MIREHYIAYRNANNLPGNLLYEYYKKHHTKGTLYNEMEFVQAMQAWPGNAQAARVVVEYYDREFGVNKLINLKTNQILMYL